MKELIKIQAELKAPKGQYNNFGKYKYRSCEDITEAVKPLLTKNKCVLTINDEIMLVGDRYYIKATAILQNGTETISVSAYAREPNSKKGMDEAQITGSTSSYARKYALNGLFAIDDTKDSDHTNTGGGEDAKEEKEKVEWNSSLRSKALGFGKHKDLTWADVPSSYLKWIVEQGGKFSDVAHGELAERDNKTVEQTDKDDKARVSTIKAMMKKMVVKVGKEKGLAWIEEKIGKRKIDELDSEQREKLFSEFSSWVDSETEKKTEPATDKLPF